MTLICVDLLRAIDDWLAVLYRAGAMITLLLASVPSNSGLGGLTIQQ